MIVVGFPNSGGVVSQTTFVRCEQLPQFGAAALPHHPDLRCGQDEG